MSEQSAEADQGAQQFCLDLLALLYKNGTNLVFSPHSLLVALAMLYPGTSGNTRAQLIKSLFNGKDDEGKQHFELFAATNKANLVKNQATLKVANFLYSDKSFPLNAEFVTELTSKYSAIGKHLDFTGAKTTALKTINSDVSKATNGLIEQLLDDIDNATVLILVNAIHFKGLWAKPFDVVDTNEDGVFHLASGSTVKAPLMFKKKKFPFYRDEATQTKAVQLDYQKEGNIAMVLILPGEGVPMESFLKTQLTATKLENILGNMYSHQDVKLTLPRFNLTATHQLVEPLTKLGLTDLFDASKADLSRISSSSIPLAVSKVIQKAVIEVNEEGTEAAAATAICVEYKMMMVSQEAEFKADRPFVFALVTLDQPKQLLFIGVVDDPTK